MYFLTDFQCYVDMTMLVVASGGLGSLNSVLMQYMGPYVEKNAMLPLLKSTEEFLLSGEMSVESTKVLKCLQNRLFPHINKRGKDPQMSNYEDMDWEVKQLTLETFIF